VLPWRIGTNSQSRASLPFPWLLVPLYLLVMWVLVACRETACRIWSAVSATRDGLAQRSGPIWYTDELSTIMARERNLRHMSSQATVGPARRRSGGLDRDRYRRDMVTDAYH
jgi:hypothetical protein